MLSPLYSYRCSLDRRSPCTPHLYACGSLHRAQLSLSSWTAWLRAHITFVIRDTLEFLLCIFTFHAADFALGLDAAQPYSVGLTHRDIRKRPNGAGDHMTTGKYELISMSASRRCKYSWKCHVQQGAGFQGGTVCPMVKPALTALPSIFEKAEISSSYCKSDSFSCCCLLSNFCLDFKEPQGVREPWLLVSSTFPVHG